MVSPVTVMITGAAGQIGYALAPQVCRGAMLGPDTPIILHLLDIPPAETALKGVAMELVDAAYPLVKKIVATVDLEEACKGVDVAVMVGGFPRGPGMERKDVMAKNVAIYKGQASALQEHASPDVKVVVVANPANTNALILSNYAPKIPKENVTCLTRLDHNRALGQVSERTGVPVSDVKNCIIWGNHSSTQYPDVNHATAGGKSVRELVNDDEYLNGEFVTTVQQRGAAVQQADGTWLLNGRKMWITNGCIDEEGTPADVVWVYARTGEDERGRVQMSTFLVEAGMPGYSVGQKIYDKTGMRASNTAELVFDDCVVPAANLVGGVGESLLHMMGNLELERLTLAGMALGIGRRALDEMNRYATDRTAFGSPIRDFGQIQRYIGESWAKYRAMRAYIYDTANNLVIGTSGQRLDSDGVKLFATTAAKEIADAAMQVMGGYGYVGEYHVERLWRDAKLLEIGGGTLESHQKNITRDLLKDDEAVNR